MSFTDRKNNFYFKLTDLLPKGLIYWCFIRVSSNATYAYPSKTPDEINLMEALNAWKY